jgi:hypothetical protein
LSATKSALLGGFSSAQEAQVRHPHECCQGPRQHPATAVMSASGL